MLIKHQALTQYLNKHLPAVFILGGQDNYLLEEAQDKITSAINAKRSMDKQIIHVKSLEDWRHVFDEANSYSLFSDGLILIVSMEAKSFDAQTKKIITQYLESTNPQTYIIIRAPNVPSKQAQWIANHNQVLTIISYPLNTQALTQWIAMQLKHYQLGGSAHIPALIEQYTQGNMQAAAQVIEKLSLSYPQGTELTEHQVLEHLSCQSAPALFDLIEACLSGQTDRAIHIIRYALQSKTEPTLLLWMLTQEIRNLYQLHCLTSNQVSFQNAAAQLKLWSSRVNLYKNTLAKTSGATLTQLLKACYHIDLKIKMGAANQVQNALESLVLSLTHGKIIGGLCAI